MLQNIDAKKGDIDMIGEFLKIYTCDVVGTLTLFRL